MRGFHPKPATPLKGPDMWTRKNRFAKPALVVVLVVLAAGSVAGLRATQAKKDAKAPEPAVVLEFSPEDLARVEMRALSRSIPFSGSLTPVERTTVKSRVAGDLRSVRVREGESVSRGQILAQIDTTDLQSRLDAQAAALEEARARLSLAAKNRENNRQLLRRKFISQNAFDTTQSAFEAAAAAVKSAEAELRIASKAMEDAAVRAPFGGIVARRHVNAGEMVGVDSPLFSLVDLGRMEIEAPAPASDVPQVRPGQAASFHVDGFGERRFTGRVERINPTTEEGSRSILLHISVGNPDGTLRGGMFAKGEIVLERTANVPVVPVSAIREEAGQSFVYALEAGRITRRPVKLGRSEPREGVVEVRSGLEQGVSVVSARVAGLKAGAPAALKKPQPKAL